MRDFRAQGRRFLPPPPFWWSVPLCAASLLAGCDDAKLTFGALRNDNEPKPNGGAAETMDTTTPLSAEAPLTQPVDQTDPVGPEIGPQPALGDGSAPVLEPDNQVELDGSPLYSHYVRLTHQQWENSVVDNLRLGAPTGEFEAFSADQHSRYSNNEAVLVVGEMLVTDYQRAAERVAQRIVEDPAALDAVSTAREPEAFIAEVGRRFYRRPLTSAEQATYLTLFDTGASLVQVGQESFAAGAQLLLEVWMQAPSFLYRVEHSEGWLDGYEVATRLAYLMTDSAPSESLLAAAEAGALDTPNGVTEAAQELLATPRAALVFRRFHDETFLLARLADLQFREGLELDVGLNGQLIESSHLFFDRVFRQELGLRDLLLSDVGYVSAALAPLYGVPAPAADEFELVTWGPSRRGVFAQLPFLMVDSINETPNAFRRGALFTKYVLCQTNLQQPEVVPPLPVPADDSMTNRERSSALVAAPACQACHQYIDPFGFAFENFDGLGRERTTDNGLPVDTSGTYPYAEGQQFADSTQLMAVLAESPLAHGCYVKQLAEFGLSRELASPDAELVGELRAASLDRGAPLAELVTSLVSSETFRSAGVTP